jgi:hypothetical protein
MSEAIEFLTNPDFHKLPLGDRLEVLRKDPNFSNLNPKDQGEIVSKAQQKVTPGATVPEVQHPKDAGLFSTLGQDAKDLVTSLIPKNPSDIISPGVPIARGMIEGAKDQLKQGYEAFKKKEYSSAFGHTLAALTPNGPQAAQGAEEVSSGQYGQGAAHIIEALAPFAAHGLSEIPAVAKTGRAIGTGLKVAAPDVAAGFGKAGAGMATGATMHAVGLPGSDFSTALLTRPGLRQMGQGLVSGARAAVEDFKNKPQAPIGDVTPPGKGPSIGQLKTAVKNGTITTDQFNASIDKMTDLNPEAKELHKADIQASVPSQAVGPVETPKTLNIGQLERLVKIGRIDPEEFNNRLVGELKYKPADAEHLTELLKKQIEDEDAAEKAEGTKSSSKPGKVESPVKKNPELNNPISDEELQGRINNNLGQVNPPGHESFLETEAPYKPPITEHQIEESQSTDRAAKETTLARHFADKEKFPELPSGSQVTSEYLKAVGNEAGLKHVPSLRTFENSIKRAKQLRGEGLPNNPERGSFSLRDLKVDNPAVKLNKLFSDSDKTISRPPLPGEIPKTDLTPPEVPGKLIGRTTGKEMSEGTLGKYGPGFGIYEVPIDKVIGTEDISDNAGKMADAEKYSKMTTEAPPLWGHVNENGNVSIQGARRLEAAKRLGQKTVKVAIGQDYQGPKN